MSDQVDLNKYGEFVDTVCSDDSKEFKNFIERMRVLNEQGFNVPQLMTGSMGLSSESGEFNEIVKKTFFHGEDMTDEKLFHMKRELGDIIWYWLASCLAMGFDPNEIVAMNVEKLEKRYPGGVFSVYFSANRQEGDI
jgi:NTP pyrophosphatase (non-canonical NTP hydrolase)